MRDSLLVILAAIVLTVLFTWPMAARFERAGRVDSGDGRYSIWNVAWVAHALTTNPARLYDANIFHPHTRTLAFSDPNLVSGVMAIPAWLVTGNAMAASNWVTMWSFVLACLTMFWLVRYLTGGIAGAVLSALLFAFCPYVFAHLPHVQLLMTFGLPWSLLAMHRFIDRPDVRRAAWLGLALAVQALACGYYGIFAGLAVAWGMLWFGITGRRWRDRRYWAGGVLAALVAAVIVLPFLVPVTATRAAGFARTIDDARLFAAGWRDYLASPMLLHRWMLPIIERWGEVLFPGFVAIGLAAVAVIRGFGGNRSSGDPVSRAVLGFYLTLAVLAMWASFGPDAGLYGVMYDTLPFFSLLRASARFGLLVTLALAVLAGIALADVARRGTGIRRQVLVGSVLLVTLARSTTGPLGLVDRPDTHVVYQRLAQLPRGAVAEFPFFSGPADRHRHTEYMLASTLHWQPLINGYSDHTPEEAFADMRVLETFPHQDAWDVLERRGARYLVMHWNMYDGRSPHQEIRTTAVGRHLRSIVDQDDVSLFEIIAWP